MGQFDFAKAENLDERTPSRGYVLRIDVSNLVPDYYTLVSLFSSSDARQYYFPKSDIHITVFEFVSSRPDFRKYEGNIHLFKKVTERVLSDFGRFEIELVGTVFTNSSGLVAGVDGGKLIEIRERLRKELKTVGIEPLERYRSISSHISFMAFRTKPKSEEHLLSLIEKTKEMNMGVIEVSTVELVEQDWYSREKNRKLIWKYKLGKIS